MFESLLVFLRFTSSSLDLDSALHLLECICSPLSKLKVKQVNEMVAAAAASKIKALTAGQPLLALKAEKAEEAEVVASPPLKRKSKRSASVSSASAEETTPVQTPVVIEPTAPAVQPAQEDEPKFSAPVRNSDGAIASLSVDITHNHSVRYYCGRLVGQGGYASPCGHCDGRCGPTNGCQCRACAALPISPADVLAGEYAIDHDPAFPDIPFPELTQGMMECLANVAGSDLCGGTMRKQILRILATLALYDGNWTGIMQELSRVGSRLASASARELLSTHEMLKRVAEVEGDAAYGNIRD